MMTILVISLVAILVTCLVLLWRTPRDPLAGQRRLGEFFSSVDEEWDSIMDDYR